MSAIHCEAAERDVTMPTLFDLLEMDAMQPTTEVPA